MKDIIILVPTYNPDEDIMLSFLNELKKSFKRILVVNDGSKSKHKQFFDKISSGEVTVIHHKTNKGKGRAIKTGFEYITKNYKNYLGVITADCDGQHTVSDIKKCAYRLKKYPNDLIVGCRDFNKDDVPKRSSFGNKLTRLIFKLFIGVSITDTQSGLRGFGKDLIKIFVNTDGERYEYETNMLIDCKTYNISIQEVPIQTVYLNNNEGSHFNPIKDSLKIYKLFLKYIVSATSSFVLDILFFSIFLRFLNTGMYDILIATILARILSSTYNFILNYKFVFNNGNKSSIIKYIILVIVQMFISGYLVTFIVNILHVNETVTKVIVDTIIFIVNFIIQREWVFSIKKKK